MVFRVLFTQGEPNTITLNRKKYFGEAGMNYGACGPLLMGRPAAVALVEGQTLRWPC